MKCGICQKELFGVAESSQGLTVCGSCVMAPLPPRPDDLDKAQVDDVNFDLDYLNQLGQREQERALNKDRKSVNQVRMDLGPLSLQEPNSLQEKPVKKLKLKSNSVRDRIHPIGSLMLRFNEKGVAEFAECHLAEVKTHMALRPGRFRLLEVSDVSEKATILNFSIHPAKALEKARAALVAARAVPEPEPEPEPAPEELPKAKKTRKKKSSVGKSEAE